jgi:hypothetical protein
MDLISLTDNHIDFHCTPRSSKHTASSFGNPYRTRFPDASYTIAYNYSPLSLSSHKQVHRELITMSASIFRTDISLSLRPRKSAHLSDQFPPNLYHQSRHTEIGNMGEYHNAVSQPPSTCSRYPRTSSNSSIALQPLRRCLRPSVQRRLESQPQQNLARGLEHQELNKLLDFVFGDSCRFIHFLS